MILTLLFWLTLIASKSRASILLPDQDLSALFNSTVQVNGHDFKYILNPRTFVCGEDHGVDVTVLVYVHSTPENFKRRLSIRETWARRSMFKDLRVVFMLGRTHNQVAKKSLSLEAQYYNDIVMEDFDDSYKNLTYKGIMAMKWISEYCDKVSFILKTDDDIIIDTFKLLHHLKNIATHTKPTRTIFCKMYAHMPAIRDKKNKWYISKDEYPFDRFGPYCSGSAFIMTPDLAEPMYKISHNVKFVWVDDFYITGLLIRAANGSYSQMSSAILVKAGMVESKFKSQMAPIFGHLGRSKTIGRMYNVWSFVLSKSLSNFPSLTKYPFTLNRPDDFGIYEFVWTDDIWKPFLKLKDHEEKLLLKVDPSVEY